MGTIDTRHRPLTKEQLDDPYLPRSQGQMKWSREVVERCLFEVARWGGSTRKAYDALESELGPERPHFNTMGQWIRGRFRNRYSAISTARSAELETLLASQATELALELTAAERRALSQSLAGLHNATGVEASIILRNFSQSKQIQIDKAAAIRGRPSVIVDHRGLGPLAEALARMGVASIEADFEDVTEEGEGAPPPPDEGTQAELALRSSSRT